ncbi:hypothetical protein [Prochlorococcus sp. MIT 1307]|uniref:hypothetical protein n=1 Tax=Prochlorococcus sp. MIT 1307 TaxID=3096219 RepID=UPI002A7621C6|nr:hypothetical protein [Prochlorococcus sp. MIT 1307]
MGRRTLISTGIVLTSTALIAFSSQKLYADDDTFIQGVKKFTAGDHYGAISNFTKAIEIYGPKSIKLPLVYTSRGNAKKNLGDCNGAIDDFNKAIQINPDFAIAYHFRGHCRTIFEDFHLGLSDFTTAINLDKELGTQLREYKGSTFYLRGLTKYILNDYKGACIDYRKALAFGEKEAAARITEDCS